MEYSYDTKKPDSLFSLIKSLTKAEKRIITTSADSEAKYIKLFTILAEMKQYDEVELARKSGFVPNKKSLHTLKQYLYDFILEKLSNLNPNEDLKKNLLLKLLQCRFLYDKGLYDEVRDLADHVLQKATEADFFELAQEALTIFLLLNDKGVVNIEKRIITIGSHIQKLNELTINTTICHETYVFFYRNFHKAKSVSSIKKLVKELELQLTKTQTKKAQTYTCAVISVYCAFLYNKGEVDYYSKWDSFSVRTIELSKEMYTLTRSSEDLNLFVGALLSYVRLGIAFRLHGKEHKKIVLQLEVIQTVLINENKHPQLRQEIQDNLLANKIVTCFHWGDILAIEIEKNLPPNKEPIEVHLRFNLFFLLAFVALIRNNYRRSTFWINKCVSLGKYLIPTQLARIDLLNLICSYESNSFSLDSDIGKLEYKLKQWEGQNFLIVEEWVSAIKSISSSRTNNLEIQEWQRLGAAVAKVDVHVNYKLFDVAWWEIYLQSKIKSISLLQAYKEYIIPH